MIMDITKKITSGILFQALESLYYTVITDNLGYIVFISKNYAELLCINERDVLGKHIKKVIPNTKIPDVLKSGKEDIGDIFVLNNGKTVMCNRIPIKDENNTIIGVVSVATFDDMNRIEELSRKIKMLQEENHKYKKKLKELKNEMYSIDNVIGTTKAMLDIKDTIKRMAKSPIRVLITGETGTGKEVFANYIHGLSDRSEKPFVKINCAAIPKELIESELFGYSPGAFSGASKEGKIGKFEMANGGSILLDEIGEMPLSLQQKLLRVIQEKEIVRIGDKKTIKLDIRIICSTNKDIEELIKNGQFREDLYYRINVVELKIPPLRERIEDIRKLANYFIEKTNRSYGLGINEINEDVIGLFMEYTWPGNVRELENVIERACVLVGSGELKIEDFGFFIKKLNNETNSLVYSNSNNSTLEEAKTNTEKEVIMKTLLEAKGNKTVAAKMLGIDRSFLYTKLKKYNINL